MGTFQVEMLWRCSTCEHENLGRHKECQNCGKPKEGEVFYDTPGEVTRADAVTDSKLLKQAKAGPDWECAYCGSHQRRDSGECAQCGAGQALSRDKKTRWDDGTEGRGGEGLTELEKLQAEAEADEALADPDPPPKRTRRKRQPRKRHDSPVPIAVDVPKRKLVTPARRNVAIGLLAVALLGVLCYFLFRTRIVDVEVTAVAWTRTVKVERYQVVRQSGFDRPGDAFDVQSDGMRHHHYKQVQDGTKQVPYTERYACGTTPRVCRTTPVRCTSNNNGFKTCSGGNQVCSGGDTKYCTRTKYRTEPKYKDVSVKREHFRWKVWRWQHNRDVTAKGTTEPPQWPSEAEIALGRALGPEAKEERESGREAAYEVTFTDTEGETHGYTPKDLDEFMELRPGVKHKIKIGAARSTEIVREPQDG